MEIIRPPFPGKYKSALFDFDGTISLLREGWQQIMNPYFIDVLAAADQNSDLGAIERCVTEFVDLLTGKQTIFQCIRLAEEVEKRGGHALDPYDYKREYLRRLAGRIEGRLSALRSREAAPVDYLVPGAAEFIKSLRERGLKLYLVSGTDEADVRDEARLLEVDTLFDGGIYGAANIPVNGLDTKEIVIRKILTENGMDGSELVAFGDGYIEIQLVKEIGGYAVAVATNEETRQGVNPWKRERLLKAQADAVIPDFAEHGRLIQFICG